MKKTLRVENLIKRYPLRQGMARWLTFWRNEKRTVVNRANIHIEQGEVVGLLGPNGAGKTTTFYMIVGLVRPNLGRVFFDDKDITQLPMYRRAALGIGYLPQEASVFRKLTVQENLDAILETRTIKTHHIMSFIKKSSYDFLEKYARWKYVSTPLHRLTKKTREDELEEVYDFLSEEMSGFSRAVVLSFIEKLGFAAQRQLLGEAVNLAKKDILLTVFGTRKKQHFWNSDRSLMESIDMPDLRHLSDEKAAEFCSKILWAFKKKEVRECLDVFLQESKKNVIEQLLADVMAHVCSIYRDGLLADYIRINSGGANDSGLADVEYAMQRVCSELDRKVEANVQKNLKKQITRAALKSSGKQFLGLKGSEAFVQTIYDTVEVNISKLSGKRMEKVRSAYKRGLREELLEYLNIDHLRHQRGYTLSGGERRRTEIARALTTEPSFLLLDEPFAGVDPIAVADIQEVVTKLKDRNLGVVISDHNVRETLKITDRAYILADGEILISGSKEQLVDDREARRIYLGDDFSL